MKTNSLIVCRNPNGKGYAANANSTCPHDDTSTNDMSLECIDADFRHKQVVKCAV